MSRFSSFFAIILFLLGATGFAQDDPGFTPDPPSDPEEPVGGPPDLGDLESPEVEPDVPVIPWDAIPNSDGTISIPGLIDEDVTLTADFDYKLTGIHYVMPGVTLTVEPGVVFYAEEYYGTEDSFTALIITQGGFIDARGSSESPVIFTSVRALEETLDHNDVGLWGGISILGNSRINSDVDQIASGEGIVLQNSLTSFEIVASGRHGLSVLEEQELLKYGGNDDTGDSGSLDYVSIRHAGSPVTSAYGEEFPALLFAGAGEGTTLSNIEVFATAGDGLSIRGGLFDLRFFSIAYTPYNAVDVDEGFRGTLQYGLIVRAAFENSYSYWWNGFRGNAIDLRGARTPETNVPRSSAQFANLSIVQLSSLNYYNDRDIFAYRSAAVGKIFNSVAVKMGSRFVGIDASSSSLDNRIIEEAFQSGDSQIAGNLFYNWGQNTEIDSAVFELVNFDDYPGAFEILAGEGSLNSFGDPEIGAYIESNGYVLLNYPTDGLLFANESVYTLPEDSPLEQTDFRGAFDDEDWANWTHLAELGHWVWTEEFETSSDRANEALDTLGIEFKDAGWFILDLDDQRNDGDYLRAPDYSGTEANQADLRFEVEGPAQVSFDYLMHDPSNNGDFWINVYSISEDGYNNYNRYTNFYDLDTTVGNSGEWAEFSLEIPTGKFEIILEARQYGYYFGPNMDLFLDNLIITQREEELEPINYIYNYNRDSLPVEYTIDVDDWLYLYFYHDPLIDLEYQWYRDDEPLADQNYNNLSLNIESVTEGGSYKIELIGSGGKTSVIEYAQVFVPDPYEGSDLVNLALDTEGVLFRNGSEFRLIEDATRNGGSYLANPLYDSGGENEHRLKFDVVGPARIALDYYAHDPNGTGYIETIISNPNSYLSVNEIRDTAYSGNDPEWKTLEIEIPNGTFTLEIFVLNYWGGSIEDLDLRFDNLLIEQRDSELAPLAYLYNINLEDFPSDNTVEIGEWLYLYPYFNTLSQVELQWLRDGESVPGGTYDYLYMPIDSIEQTGAYSLQLTSQQGITSEILIANVYVPDPYTNSKIVNQALDTEGLQFKDVAEFLLVQSDSAEGGSYLEAPAYKDGGDNYWELEFEVDGPARVSFDYFLQDRESRGYVSFGFSNLDDSDGRTRNLDYKNIHNTNTISEWINFAQELPSGSNKVTIYVEAYNSDSTDGMVFRLDNLEIEERAQELAPSNYTDNSFLDHLPLVMVYEPGVDDFYNAVVGGLIDFHLQWYKDGSILENQDGTFLEIYDASVSDEGLYSMRLTNNGNGEQEFIDYVNIYVRDLGADTAGSTSESVRVVDEEREVILESIGFSGDIDLYRFSSEYPFDLFAYTAGGLHLEGYILDEFGRTVWSDDSEYFVVDFDVDLSLGPGTYYLGIESSPGYDQVGVYALDMHFEIHYPIYRVEFKIGEYATLISGELEQTLITGQSATAPQVQVSAGWQFEGWDVDFSVVTSDLVVNAVYSKIVYDVLQSQEVSEVFSSIARIEFGAQISVESGGPEWSYVDWFGMIETLYFPWIYHVSLGWVLIEEVEDYSPNGLDTVWVWMPGIQEWYLFSEYDKPWIWSASASAWHYYYDDGENSWIYDYSVLSWKLIDD